MMDRKCFRVTYKSFRARSASTYPFSPYLLKEYRNRWFVLGRTHVKQAVLLTLALDRIENMEEMEQGGELFIPNTDVDLDMFFKDVIGVTRSLKSRPVHVVFKADRKNAPYLKTKPMHSSQRIVEEDENGTAFSIDVILNFELEREFLGFGSSVEVLAPRVLRNRIRRIVTEASVMYGE
jgi:predicted DNA-binding transcriptional regulator YafY